MHTVKLTYGAAEKTTVTISTTELDLAIIRYLPDSLENLRNKIIQLTDTEKETFGVTECLIVLAHFDRG